MVRQIIKPGPVSDPWYKRYWDYFKIFQGSKGQFFGNQFLQSSAGFKRKRPSLSRSRKRTRFSGRRLVTRTPRRRFVNRRRSKFSKGSFKKTSYRTGRRVIPRSMRIASSLHALNQVRTKGSLAVQSLTGYQGHKTVMYQLYTTTSAPGDTQPTIYDTGTEIHPQLSTLFGVGADPWVIGSATLCNKFLFLSSQVRFNVVNNCNANTTLDIYLVKPRNLVDYAPGVDLHTVPSLLWKGAIEKDVIGTPDASPNEDGMKPGFPPSGHHLTQFSYKKIRTIALNPGQRQTFNYTHAINRMIPLTKFYINTATELAPEPYHFLPGITYGFMFIVKGQACHDTTEHLQTGLSPASNDILWTYTNTMKELEDNQTRYHLGDGSNLYMPRYVPTFPRLCNDDSGNMVTFTS